MTNEVKNVPELRFPEFDGEWEEKKIGELSQKTISGGTPRTSKLEFWNGDIPWIQSSDLSMNKLYIDCSNKSITEEAIDNSSAKIIPAKSIAIVTRVGVGKLAFVDFKYSTSQDFISLANLIFDTNFSIYSLYNKIKIISKNLQGTSIKGITKNELLNTELLMPIDIAEQQKNGEFFSKLDRQIELEEQKLAKLEEQKKGYMQKIFSQQLGFKDENGNEYPTWQSYKLGNLYKKGKAGGTPKSTESKYYNGEVPFLSISDITEQGKFIMNTEKSITQEGVDNSTAWLVPVNSINYAMYASVGYLSINKIEVATSQAIFNMVFEDNNLVEYIYYYLNHIRDKGILEKLVGTGTQSNLSASIMKSMYIKLPDYEEMVKITDFLSKVDKLIEKQNQKIDGLKERKKGFLQKMFV
ncbi:restriction endonuclease subunit S [Mammaliicoccus fleurettii]|uniref:restriction endonuclease subunit S n=1 Tax=Mammaliicoccus fleurettii TaxID=150056 RepID=UPI001C4FAF3E|nr:restriction endonuclease subunit S [Mammaliicoccus fleurettii]MBW0765443.1 restriction endonuclease subunit S [Mammaliicoccus fleurettii]